MKKTVGSDVYNYCCQYQNEYQLIGVKATHKITVDPNIMGGRPCIRGMRIQVSLILNLVANGMTTEEIIKAYPYIESEDIFQCLHYAAWLAEDRIELLAEG